MRLIIVISVFLINLSGATFSKEVNIFSARHYDSDVQLYEKFTAKTGIKVNVLSGKDKALSFPDTTFTLIIVLAVNFSYNWTSES